MSKTKQDRISEARRNREAKSLLTREEAFDKYYTLQQLSSFVPWLLTQAEFLEGQIGKSTVSVEEGNRVIFGVNKGEHLERGREKHRYIVEHALKHGAKLPPVVLVDYPDLVCQYVLASADSSYTSGLSREGEMNL